MALKILRPYELSGERLTDISEPRRQYSLEEQIIEWSATRPPWQRAVLRRVAMGDVLSDEDCDQLVDVLVVFKEIGDASFRRSRPTIALRA